MPLILLRNYEGAHLGLKRYAVLYVFLIHIYMIVVYYLCCNCPTNSMTWANELDCNVIIWIKIAIHFDVIQIDL